MRSRIHEECVASRVYIGARVLAACLLAVLTAGCVTFGPMSAPQPQPVAGIPWQQLEYPMRGRCHNLRYFDRNCRRRAAPSSDQNTASKSDGGSSGSGQQGDTKATGQSTQTSR